ncbi:MAG: hypothetical protein ACK5MZ_02885, partial [Aestuariibaculum sp.]
LILIATAIVLVIAIFHYTKPRYTIENTEDRDRPCKVRPFRDSAYVYVPYKLTIYNNRLTSLKLSGIYDGHSYHSFAKYLLYNEGGLELDDYANSSKREKEGSYSRDSYWWFRYLIKYRGYIFPIFGRDFYYYKRYTLSNKNNRFNIKQIDKDSISKQLYALNYNLPINIAQTTIDSLYSVGNNKRFDISFKSELLIIKKIRATINSEKQEVVYVNLYDSIKGMAKQEKIEYVKEYLKLKPNDNY